MTTVHVTISGRVQGVGYRAWTVDAARTLGVQGWVRNRTNGTVEAVFQGDGTRIHQMIEKCHQGPLMARVSEVTTSDKKAPDEIFSNFTSKPTF